MKFYSGKYFDTFSEERISALEADINSQTDSYILNVNDEDYTAHLEQKYSLDIPEIHIEEVFADAIERDIPGHRFPPFEFSISDPNKMFKKQVIIYHIPYTGSIELLQLQPNPFSMMTYNANVDTRQQNILIEIVDFYNDAGRIKQRYNDEIRDLTSNYGYVRENCLSFNNRLESTIKTLIERRRQRVVNKNSLLSSLGVPIKKKEGVAETFSVPKPRLREKIIVKPIVHDKNFKPEPALDDDNYRKILKIINDVGKNFERLPSTYKGKSEEDIRDHILLILDPNFELGSAGGETFNKIGKTDISLRYDSSVVFIAECKYWKGEKAFLETIDQLLGYLTWRNSKAAIINFIKNKDFTEILSKEKATVISHPNFVRELGNDDETWFNYKFHLKEDRNRLLDLAIISFHLPQ